MTQSLTLLDLTHQISAQPAPLLLLDTCAILDILRVPFRDHLDPKIIEATKMLISRAITPPPHHLWVVISDLVEMEWQSNWEGVSKELNKDIERCQRHFTRISDVLQNFWSTAVTTGHPDLTSFPLETHLGNLGKSVLNVSLKIVEDPNCVNRAFQRLKLYQAPASKGKGEMKDCTIVEHYLECCQRLKAVGFSHQVILVSSNVTDYGEPNALRPPLDTQFSQQGIQLVTNLSWAMSLI